MRQCLTTPRGSVNINQEPCGFFPMARGIRQGDPLSPYIFILVEDILHRHIIKSIQEGAITPLHTRAPTVSHLFFADDMLIFHKANPKSLYSVARILQNFQKNSGLKLNNSKSLFFTRSRHPHTIRAISRILGFKQGTLPTTYLGVPIFYGAPKARHFQYLVDRFRLALGGWRCHFLNMAARTLLIKHVLHGMMTYPALVYAIPRATCHLLETIMRNFLWSSSDAKLKHNLIRWHKITKPKSHGGLNITPISHVNRACLLKLAWSAQTSQSLWASWFRSRYSRYYPLWYSQNPSHGSHIWKTIKSLSATIFQYSSWKVGDGKTVRVWHDTWTKYGPLKSLFPHTTFDITLTLSHLYHGLWRIPQNVPSQAQHLLRTLLEEVHISQDLDELWWIHNPKNPTCHPTIKQLKCLTLPHGTGDPFWKLVWNPYNQPIVSFLVWKLCHRKLPIDPWYQSIGFPIASMCHLCSFSCETTQHLFVDCPFSHSIWTWLTQKTNISITSCDGTLWQVTIPSSNLKGERMSYALLFATIHVIWTIRIKKIFFNAQPSTTLAIKKLILASRHILHKDGKSIPHLAMYTRFCDLPM